MQQEYRVIDNVAYTVSRTYDAADRVATHTYPDGEVATTTYNEIGAPKTLQSNWGVTSGNSTWLVSASDYNALGQLNRADFGNSRTQRWYYFGSNLDETYWGNSFYSRLRMTCVVATGNDCADDNRNGPTSQLALHYCYDAAGNMITQGDNTSGADGDLFVEVAMSISRDGGVVSYRRANDTAGTPLTQADCGSNVYILDATTMTAASSGNSRGGELDEINADGTLQIIFPISY